MNNQLGFVTVLVLITLGCGTAYAGDKNSREREALRRAQMQLQQTQGQLSSLEQEKEQLAQDLDKASKSSKSAEGRAAHLGQQLKAAQGEKESLAKELETTKNALAETQKTLAETSQKLAATGTTLQQTSADKRNLEEIKTRNEHEIALCEDKNLKLYQTGRDLMTRFEQKTCGEILTQKEPFTGLKRVEIENLMEEYRDKLDDQKIIKPPSGS